MLIVRSRIEGDIERIFSDIQAEHTPDFDYPYRALIPRHRVAIVLAGEMLAIDYPNFKASVQDRDRHTRYFRVYNAMLPRSSVFEDLDIAPLF